MGKLNVFGDSNSITIYHGSDNLKGLPKYGIGKLENDYGLGFYCTEDKSKAEIWAVGRNKNGYCNKYILKTDDLKVLELDDNNILQWLAILMKHRIYKSEDDIINLRMERFITKYLDIDVDSYDYIIGYRADDSYFKIVEMFISGLACLEDLYDLLHLGSLGKQIVLKSKKAFDNLSFVEASTCNVNILYSKYINNDIRARNQAKDIIKRSEYKKHRTDIRDLLNKG